MNKPKVSGDSSPSAALAREIADRLVAERLIAEEDRGRVEKGLATGSLKTGDWRLLAEKAADRERR